MTTVASPHALGGLSSITPTTTHNEDFNEETFETTKMGPTPRQGDAGSGNVSVDGSSQFSNGNLFYQELAFDKVGLIGREKEIRVLRQAFHTTCRKTKRKSSSITQANLSIADHKHDQKQKQEEEQEHSLVTASESEPSHDPSIEQNSQAVAVEPISKRTLVLISGHSGSGKTALAMHVRHIASGSSRNGDSDSDGGQRAFHGFFASGKCEISQKNAEEPYAGIRPALLDLCNQILCLPRDDDGGVFGAGRLSSDADTASTRSGSSTSSNQRLADDPRRLCDLRALLKRGLAKGEIQVLSNVLPDLPLVIHGADFEGIDASFGNTGTDMSYSKDDESVASMSTHLSNRNSRDPSKPWGDRVGYKAHGDRLKFALRRFVQIVCNYCPLIFVVDDLQWADDASLGILNSWMIDSRNSSLMVIGCYRSNLLEENRTLKTTLVALDESKRERSLRIVKLPIQDLEKHHINRLLVGLLRPEEFIQRDHLESSTHEDATNDSSESVQVLASIVHSKTDGNPFFIQRFLHSLVHERLLQYDETAHAWTWDDEGIQAESPSTDNIIELLKVKLMQLRHARQILPIAACLGASFSYATVCIVMRGLSIHSAHSAFIIKLFGISRFISANEISKMLRVCVREGLLEGSSKMKAHGSSSSSSSLSTSSPPSSGAKHSKTSSKKKASIYNFIHDKVQEAALDLVDPNHLQELKYRVGEILLFGLSTEELDDKIFMVTNLLNARADLIPDYFKGDRRKRAIMLNFDAGKKAISCSAFRLASTYFKVAMNMMPPNHWEVMKQETLEIYSAAAECASVNSDLARARTYCDTVINSGCDILDKIDAYLTLIDISVAGAEMKGKDSVASEICISVLAQLGCKLPKAGLRRSFRVVTSVFGLRRLARSMTTESIGSLPVVTDRQEFAIMAMLGRLTTASFFSDPELIPIITLKSIRRTLKFGVSAQSAKAVMFHGIIMGSVMDDFQARSNLAKVLFKMVDMVNDPNTTLEASNACESMLQHWTQPIEDTKDTFMETYHTGMAIGEVETAGWAVLTSLGVDLIIGTPLHEIDAIHATYSKVLLDFHQKLQHALMLVMWQADLNLRAESKHRILLVGDAFDERYAAEGSNTTIVEAQTSAMILHKIRLCAVLGDYEAGAKMSVDGLKAYLASSMGGAMGSNLMFHSVLCWYAASHAKPANRAYRKLARKYHRLLKDWKKQGHPNCPHYITILDAEKSYLDGRLNTAREHYKEAIKAAAKRGFIHDQAMASERLGDCSMDSRDEKSAKQSYREAVRLFTQWGAMRKVDELKAKVVRIFDDSA